MSSTPYSRGALGHAATLGSALLEATNGWKAATQILRKEGQQKRRDHFAGLHEAYLEPLVHPSLLEEARRTAKHGVEVRAHMQEGERVRANPHPSLKGHLDEAAEQIWHDAQKGRVLIVVDQGQDGLRGVVSAPLARVPKYNPDRTVSSKGRVIWDATAVNKVCTKEDPPQLFSLAILNWPGCSFGGPPDTPLSPFCFPRRTSLKRSNGYLCLTTMSGCLPLTSEERILDIQGAL